MIKRATRHDASTINFTKRVISRTFKNPTYDAAPSHITPEINHILYHTHTHTHKKGYLGRWIYKCFYLICESCGSLTRHVFLTRFFFGPLFLLYTHACNKDVCFIVRVLWPLSKYEPHIPRFSPTMNAKCFWCYICIRCAVYKKTKLSICSRRNKWENQINDTRLNRVMNTLIYSIRIWSTFLWLCPSIYIYREYILDWHFLPLMQLMRARAAFCQCNKILILKHCAPHMCSSKVRIYIMAANNKMSFFRCQQQTVYNLRTHVWKIL